MTLSDLVDPVSIRTLILHSSTAALAALLAVGCATFDKPLPAEPTIGVAALGATDTAVVWPRDDWWQRYGDSQLDQLITEGLAGSPTLAAARARIARAEAAAGVARAALLPQVSGNGGATYQKYSKNDIYPPPLGGSWQTDARATLDFSFEFDFWNKNGAALSAALSQAQGGWR